MLELELSYEGKILDCEYSLRLQPNGRIAGESAREPELTARGAFHSGELVDEHSGRGAVAVITSPMFLINDCDNCDI